MGQTLTHGIYLPDEGERNCYNGLAANWKLLDGAVGTVAEHTTQIAGKAPLVHTHGNITNDGKVGTAANKPLITGTGGVVQAGSFGNQANTFCEGNDSRLSDARTPVAHTHTKSDITNLFNSANTWTNTNTFQQNITYERTNFFHQANNPCYFLKDTGLEKGSLAPTTHSAYTGNWQDKNSASLGYMRFVEYDTGKQTAEIRVSNLIKNGALDPTGSTVNCGVNLELQPSGEKSLIPEINNDINLGTSTNKWKTLNGINPGALSLPNLTAQTYDPSTGWYDLDTTGWDLTGSPIDISSSVLKDGYLYICLACDSTGYVIICEGVFSYPNCYYSTSGLPVSGYARALLPVRKGTDVRLYLKGTSVYGARLFPALGNV